jgi:hypothetical protein
MQRILGRLLLLLTIAVQLAAAQETPTEVNEEAAQEAEIDALDPRSSSQDLTAEREALEPAVPTAVLAQDVRRRAGNNGVMDEIDLGRTEITGNQELPKVLYIVPWQKSDPGDLTGKPVNTLLDEVLAPIDRSEFIRQVEYYGDLYGKDEE